MKDHYDFSKAKRGLFSIGDKPFDITIHVDGSELAAHPRFELKQTSLIASTIFA